MQAAIFLIDKKESTKARNLLCNSIQTRLTIMESLQPIKNEATSNSHKEFENYLYEDIKRDKPKFHAICI